MTDRLTQAHNEFIDAGQAFREVCEEELIAKVRELYPEAALLQVTAIIDESYTEHEVRVLDRENNELGLLTEHVYPGEGEPPIDEDWFLTVTEGVCVFDTYKSLPMPEDEK